ncbi:MAG TPA: DUF2254 domain-containing protein [Chloroflexia bacterium]|nr:DUF2254 domain-containing protein [Chloroflexia bacterium]
MDARLVQARERLRTSLWVVPTICTLVVALLAAAVIAFDQQAGPGDSQLLWSFQGGADAARTVLTTIAASMITVAGTVYSLTIVALTLTSVQFAPRVLRHFMRDRGNQVVLGFFVATFAYCLLVLRVVRGPGADEFVPRSAVAGGLLLALISLGMLIYFIDHIFHSIEASNILASVAHETERQIDFIYPTVWTAGADAPPPTRPPGEWAVVPAQRSGYWQYVDTAALLEIAIRHDVVLWQERRIGTFFANGAPLIEVLPAGRVTPGLSSALNAAFALGRAPTLQQDVAYGFRQIVDIALKALSSAVNDPTTAENCIDHLGALLLRLASRCFPPMDLRDAAGQMRVYLNERNFHDMVRLAFDQVRHYAASDHVVLMRILDALTQVAGAAGSPAHRATILEVVEHIAATAARSLADPLELGAVQRHVAAARVACVAGRNAPATAGVVADRDVPTSG